MCLWPPYRDLVRAKPGCRLVTQEEAAKADIVVVAVGADHYHRLPLGMLKHKVVIDVANFTAPPSPQYVVCVCVCVCTRTHALFFVYPLCLLMCLIETSLCMYI